MKSYVPLNVRSSHSIGQSICQIPRLVAKARAMGFEALALVDWRRLFGAREFHAACRSRLPGGDAATPPVKPILGLTSWVKCGDGIHLAAFLAKNRKGYLNLVRLASSGGEDDPDGGPPLPFALLEKNPAGLVCLASAADASFADDCRRVFGEDFAFLATRDELDLSRWPSAYVCAARPVRFLERGDADAFNLYRAYHAGMTIYNPDLKTCDGTEYLLSDAELAAFFPRHPEWIENTRRLADRIEDYELDAEPDFAAGPVPGPFASACARLRHLVREGAEARWGAPPPPAVSERLEYELSVIEAADGRYGREPFANYFLTVADFIRAGRLKGANVGPGRGSAVGCAVAYALGITSIDPVRHNLLFERFINEDAPIMPDIDVDVDGDGRDKIVTYLVERYGAGHVAEVVTHTALSPRTAIEAVGRVMQLPHEIIDPLLSLVPLGFKTTMESALKESPRLRVVFETGSRLERRILSAAGKLDGCIASRGVHACGIAVSRRPLAEVVPVVHRGKAASLPLAQYGPRDIESVGLVRFDLLGLDVLARQAKALAAIAARGERVPDLNAIPEDDAETLAVFESGDTEGLFLFDLEGMKGPLAELKPLRLSDLTVLNALYRPGLLELIPAFIRRKRGEALMTDDHPLMADILAETFGLIVFQEQVMLLAQRLAGFERGLSATLRRALAHRRSEELAPLRGRFLSGCLANSAFRTGGCADAEGARTTAAKIWDRFEKTAPLVFNKSHALAYAWLAYQCAFLKAHYRNDFERS